MFLVELEGWPDGEVSEPGGVADPGLDTGDATDAGAVYGGVVVACEGHAPPPELDVVREDAGRQSVWTSQLVQSKVMVSFAPTACP